MRKEFIIKAIFFLLLISCVNISYAQYEKVEIEKSIAESRKLDVKPVMSKVHTQELFKEVEYDQYSSKWNSSVKSFEKKHKVSNDIERIVEEKTKLKLKNLKAYYPDKEETKGVNSTPPIINANFQGNLYDGHFPPDNTMAISNDGYIVSVVNSNIAYFNESGDLLYQESLYDFFSDPSLVANLFDPVVLYDNVSDRFFMVVLHGGSSGNSKVIACFSKTNNPLDGWWAYKLSGDPLNENLWWDYPKIGVSNNEVYITGNLYNSYNLFQYAMIYQIDKYSGYAGESLTYTFWHDILQEPSTLVPVSYGQDGSYGPGIYFISSKNSSDGDKFKLYDLTGDISDSPSLNVYLLDADFAVAGSALQLGSSVTLKNNDTRVLDAFYLNGIVHFVFHSEYINGYNGINYNRLNISSLSSTSLRFGLDGFDYSFPSVASFGIDENDKSVMISCLRSGSTRYPEVRVVNCDDYGYWSGSKVVKMGETYVDNAEEIETRWGDYTKICRKYNEEEPEVWMAGQYGTIRYLSAYGDTHCFETWIAQINSTVLTGNQEKMNTDKLSVFPNPVYDMFKLEFYLDDKAEIEISISNAKGEVVKVLWKDTARSGKNLLSFNKGALSSGVYFVAIKSNDKVITQKKIIVK